MTNLIRRCCVASLLIHGEAQKAGRAKATDKATFGRMTWLRTGCLEGKAGQAERPVTGATVIGVRGAIVPKRRKPREVWARKPRRGKGARKVELQEIIRCKDNRLNAQARLLVETGILLNEDEVEAANRTSNCAIGESHLLTPLK